MSMNLRCDQVELWQTPTYITYMCMAGPDGRKYAVSGDDAKRALIAYMEWVVSTIPDTVITDADREHYEQHKKLVNDHLRAVRQVLDDPYLFVHVL